MADAVLKNLKIKTGVVKRYSKEFLYYGKETLREEERYKKFEAEGKDSYELNKQKEVIAESSIMIGDTKNRLKASMADLNKVIEESSGELSESKEYKEAQIILQEAQKVLDEDDAKQKQEAGV